MNPKTNPNRAFLDQKRFPWPGWMRGPVEIVKALWRRSRAQKWMTLLLGPQYSRSRNRIEIDITYRCNLRCLNCSWQELGRSALLVLGIKLRHMLVLKWVLKVDVDIEFPHVHACVLRNHLPCLIAKDLDGTMLSVQLYLQNNLV